MVRSMLRRLLCVGLGGAAVVAGLSQVDVASASPTVAGADPDVVAPTIEMIEAPAELRRDIDPAGLTWRWRGVDEGDPLGEGLHYEYVLAYYDPNVAPAAAPSGVPSALYRTFVSTSDGPGGGDGCLYVRAVDQAGNRSPYVRACTFLDLRAPVVAWNLRLFEDPGRLITRGHAVSWSGADYDRVAAYRVDRIEARPGRAFGVWKPAMAPSLRTSLARRTPQGTATCYRLSGIDRVGRVGIPVVGLYGSRLYCVATPLDDRAVRVVGPHRRVRDRGAALGTTTRIASGGAVVVGEQGVRVVHVELRGRPVVCPRLEVDGRRVKARCQTVSARRGGTTVQYELSAPRSGRFVIRPRGGEPIRLDSVSFVRYAS